MLDIGWSELLVIGVVALIVVGPKELPQLFRTVAQYVNKARGMAREFQRNMEDAARDAGMDDVTKSVRDVGRLAKGGVGGLAQFGLDNSRPMPGAPRPPTSPVAAVPQAAPLAAPAQPIAPQPVAPVPAVASPEASIAAQPTIPPTSPQPVIATEGDGVPRG